MNLQFKKEKKIYIVVGKFIRFDFVTLFNDISTFVGYLMPMLFS